MPLHTCQLVEVNTAQYKALMSCPQINVYRILNYIVTVQVYAHASSYLISSEHFMPW